MRIESHPHGMRRSLDLTFGSAAGQQRRDRSDVLGRQHVSLWEDKPVDRICWGG
jgi:hypothetical protein